MLHGVTQFYQLIILYDFYTNNVTWTQRWIKKHGLRNA